MPNFRSRWLTVRRSRRSPIRRQHLTVLGEPCTAGPRLVLPCHGDAMPAVHGVEHRHAFGHDFDPDPVPRGYWRFDSDGSSQCMSVVRNGMMSAYTCPGASSAREWPHASARPSTDSAARRHACSTSKHRATTPCCPGLPTPRVADRWREACPQPRGQPERDG